MLLKVQVAADLHKGVLQNMRYPYLQRRGELVADVLRQSQSFGMRDEIAHDGILLMDRIMSTAILVRGLLPLPRLSQSHLQCLPKIQMQETLKLFCQGAVSFKIRMKEAYIAIDSQFFVAITSIKALCSAQTRPQVTIDLAPKHSGTSLNT